MGQRHTKKYMQALVIARQIPNLLLSAGLLSALNLYSALYRQGYYWNGKKWHKTGADQGQPKG